MDDKRQRTVTILTLLFVVLWVISAVVRIFHAWPEASVLDSAMPFIVGFWFYTGTQAKKNGEQKAAAT